MADGSTQGITHDRFAAVRDVFDKNLRSGADLGASFCATVEGETVVDLWGGFADPAKSRPWARDTIVNVYSTTKTMTALTALLVADRGGWISTRRSRAIGPSSPPMGSRRSRCAT